MSRSCLVTGAAGFIGSQLCRALVARGDRVLGVDNFDPFYDEMMKRENLRGVRGDRFRLIEADIRDWPRMRSLFAEVRPDVVFHFAALAGVRPSMDDPHRYVDVNVVGLVTLLEAMREGGRGRLVLASSSSVYGDNEKAPFAENDPLRHQISPYAATKRAGELIAETWARAHGLRVAILRLFTVFGPAQRPDLAVGKFMRHVARDRPLPMFGDGSTSRDYTYVDDVVDGVLAAAERIDEAEDGFSRIWNIGHSRPVRLRDLIDAIGRVVGRTPRIERRPLQRGDVRRTWADLTRVKVELGYEPTVDFEDGLKRQWEWLRPRL